MIAAALTILLLWSPRADGQLRPTRHFPVRSGLAQSQVTSTFQCDRGYLWIGTFAGISRFDGQRFVTFTTLDGLPDDVVTAVHGGGSGSLLIGTDSGRAARLRDSRFLVLDPGSPPTPVVGLTECEGDVVVAGLRGLLRLGAGQTFDVLRSDPVRVFANAPDGRALAVGTSIVEIFPDGTLRPLVTTAAATSITAAASDGNGWLLGLEDGTVLRSAGSGTWREAAHLSDVSIGALLLGSDGTLWMGTNHGLWSVEPDGKLRRHRLGPDSSLDEVRSLLEDREGNIWVGTWGDGLYQLAGSAFSIIDQGVGLPNTTVWAFLEDPRGCVWLATEDAGALHWCDGAIADRLVPGRELPHARVMDLAFDDQGTLWLATAAGLVRRQTDGRLARIGVAEGLPDAYVTALARAPGQGIWATTRGGLALVADRVLASWGTEQGLPDSNLRDVAVDAAGRLWIATHAGGLVHYDGARFTRITTADGLPHDRVWCVAVDSRNVVWAGTDAGLWLRNASGGAARVVGAADGLPSQNVLFVVEDANGSMWTGTTRGVAVVSAVGEVLRTFTADDGLTGSEGNEGAAMRASDGDIWLGLEDGVTIIDPARLRVNNHPPDLVIESLSVDGRLWGPPFPTSSGVPSPEPFLHLPPESREVRFDFAALSFTAPHKVRYRFTLEGSKGRAPTVTDERHVTFRSLPPRRYRFVLEASNDAGMWSPEPLTVDFTIPALWYKDRRALAGAAMLLLGAGAAVVLGRLRRGRDRQRQLEEQVSHRTAELNSAYRRIAEQNVLLQDLSRTDPLTGLKNRRVLAEQLPSDLAVLRREVQRVPGNRLAEFHGACVYLLDIDGFKHVNDRYGHDVGDSVLTSVARAIESTLREGDLAVRWGGDEIVVLARAIDDAGAARFAHRLLEGIAATEAGPAGSGLRVTASIGYVPCPLARSESTSGQRWQRVMEVADRLMYRAKLGGRGRACGLARTAEIADDVDEEVLLGALIESLDRLPQGLALVTFSPALEPPGDAISDPI